MLAPAATWFCPPTTNRRCPEDTQATRLRNVVSARISDTRYPPFGVTSGRWAESPVSGAELVDLHAQCGRGLLGRAGVRCAAYHTYALTCISLAVLTFSMIGTGSEPDVMDPPSVPSGWEGALHGDGVRDD